MLQKIIMVIVSVFTMIASSIAPTSLLGGGAGDDVSDALSAKGVVEQRVFTKGAAAGNAFAAVSVIWVKVDGREVLEDAWGEGTLDSISFKVGVKTAEGRVLRLGDTDVTLSPTDVITIRDFRGKFAFKDLGSTLATVALDGVVKTTTVAEGEVTGKVSTRVLDDPDRRLAAPKAQSHDLAYVVLDTGEKHETVEWETGASARLTTWGPNGEPAEGSDAVAILAKWVKIDGREIRQYTWGDGAVGEIRFEPTSRQTLGSLLNWSGTEYAMRAGESVVVRDFVGSYLVYEAEGGGMKIRLDGYARNFTLDRFTKGQLGTGENVQPVARIGYEPENPTTSDYVTFSDLSEDADGLVVFREWTFGEGNRSTILASPKHRFTTPGVHKVTLEVTDNDLASAEATVFITVRNTPPVADWDFKPKAVYSKERVLFESRAWDPDDATGPAAFEWDFGDGTPPVTGETVNHRYAKPGNYTATLKVADAHGDVNALSKVVVVKNQLPRPAFNVSTPSPLTLDEVRFTDYSVDVDGVITCWKWDFGDGTTSTEQNPVHKFRGAGTFKVTLNVCDDGGGTGAASQSITVDNRLPNPDFGFTPAVDITTGTYVQFQDNSTDKDGTIKEWRWNFGDGTPVDTRSNPRHRFTTPGVFKTCLTVKDDQNGQATACKTVGVENSPPRVDFAWSPTGPSQPVANQSISFTDLTIDPDGDSLAVWEWNFGDGSGLVTDRNPVHKYARKGTYPVTLQVTDAAGKTGEAVRSLEVRNALPSASFSWSPTNPTTLDDVRFTANATDPDGFISAYEWQLGVTGDPVVTGNPAVKRYATAGQYTVQLLVRDNDGGERILTKTLQVARAAPVANFSWAPVPPVPSADVHFTDTSVTHGAEVRNSNWNFGDGTSAVCDANGCKYSGGKRDGESTPERSPVHAYANPGPYNVRLKVYLSTDQVAEVVRSIRVNALPSAAFNVDRSNIGLGDSVKFTDASADADGQVTAWHWDFGDGTTRSTVGPHEHAFQTPGAHTVHLTVTDNDGAQHTTTRTVNVANRAPTAAFSVTPTFPQRGAPVTFTDASTDPDAPYDSIARWQWDFGDGSPVATSSNPSHAFATSGFKTVKLKVTDTAGGTGQAARVLRVTSDHDLVLELTSRLPDGRHLDHGLPNVNVSVTLDRPGAIPDVAYWKGAPGLVVQGDGSVTVTIPATEWAAGDKLAMSVRLVDRPDVKDSTSFTLTDAHALVKHTFRLAFPVVPTIGAVNGTTNAPVADFKAPGLEYKWPTYRNQTERVRLEGEVRWLDGAIAAGASVDVYVRYTGVRVLAGSLDALAPENDIAGYCRVGTVTTDAAGRFATDVPFTPHCLSLFGETGAMLPGWYQAKAVAGYSPQDPALFQATRGESAPAWFYEDPFGLVTGRVGYDRTPP